MQVVKCGDEFSGGEFAGCAHYDDSARRRRDTIIVKFADDRLIQLFEFVHGPKDGAGSGPIQLVNRSLAK